MPYSYTHMAEGHYVCIGNPLLDFMVYVKDDTIFEKYKLKKDDAILADESHKGIYAELERDFKITYVAGGAGLNTLKMIQWLFDEPERTSYFGAIGNDEFGKRLIKNCQDLRVDVNMLVDDTLETGKCAVIVKDITRSMVTTLGASVSFKESNITEDMWRKIKRGKIYYMCAYFVNSDMKTVLSVAKLASEDDKKMFCFNLSAPFLAQFFSDLINQVLPYVDILFGNTEELRAYASSNKLEDNIETVCKYLYNYQRQNVKKDRIIVITDGSNDITLYNKDGLQTFPIEKIEPDLIVDTNGAGDAFAGGFMKEYGLDKDIKECIATAKKAARYILQQNGFQLGDRSTF